MMTTWARPGSVSVIALDVLEQAAEVVGRESLRCALEPLDRPRPEVEVERAGRALDRAPERPPVLAGQAEQPGPGDPIAQRPPVVGRDQLGQGGYRALSLGPDVAQLEAAVVVARVLVVDQPDPVPVIDEFAAQQALVPCPAARAPAPQ